ncbi:MAG TPA: SLC13 family permease [Pyrinomonadaceae bacterium]|nr:SLC13 family permease [Pyrinomonadaceae bacterium]
MTVTAWITLGLLVAMLVMLVWNKLPIWLVFVGTITVAMTLQLASPAALLKGYSNTGVITVAALYPVAAGMYATGAISLLSERIIGLPKTITMAQLKVFVPLSAASAFLYNTPLVAMMIPAVRDLTRRTGLPGAKLFMGLSYGALLGGSITLIGTSVNLIIAGLVLDAVAKGELSNATRPIGLFDPAWIGIPATFAGLAFIILVGSRLLKDRTGSQVGVEKRNYRSEFRIEDSRLKGKTVEQAGLAQPVGFTVESLTRNGTSGKPAPTVVLEHGDLLAVSAPADVLPGIWTTIGLVPAYATKMFSRRHEHQLVEVVLSSRSPAIGHKVGDLPLPDSPYQLMLVGVSRHGRAPAEPLAELRLEAGDAGVVEVDDAFFYENRREADFILTKRLEGFRVQRIDRAVVAIAITVAMVVLAATGITSMLNAALLAAMAMLLSGCLTIDRLWQSVDWQTIVVLGAAVGLESAITETGLAQQAANLFASIGGRSPMIALVAVYAGTVVLTNVITNAAAAVIMFSVAVSLANSLEVSFLPFAMILMSGASTAFINPAGFQTNLMVQQPGGYIFSDFARVGIPLTLIVGAVVLLLAPIVYGF